MDVLVLTISLSFGSLGAVLLYRKFDVYYGSVCLLTAAFGIKYPILFIFPYFFVAWRVFVGRSIRTDAKLLIGQRRRPNGEAAPLWDSPRLQPKHSDHCSHSPSRRVQQTFTTGNVPLVKNEVFLLYGIW